MHGSRPVLLHLGPSVVLSHASCPHSALRRPMSVASHRAGAEQSLLLHGSVTHWATGSVESERHPPASGHVVVSSDNHCYRWRQSSGDHSIISQRALLIMTGSVYNRCRASPLVICSGVASHAAVAGPRGCGEHAFCTCTVTLQLNRTCMLRIFPHAACLSCRAPCAGPASGSGSMAAMVSQALWVYGLNLYPRWRLRHIPGVSACL